VKNKVAQMTIILDQHLRSKNRKKISAQPPVEAPIAHVPNTSQNLGENSATEQQLSSSPHPASSSFSCYGYNYYRTLL
jgi:hypothetical protein